MLREQIGFKAAAEDGNLRPTGHLQRRSSPMNSNLSDPAFWHRLQFAFTITHHYLFPQLTMGLAFFPVYWKWRALCTGDEKYNRAARFWARIFGLNFGVGVVTGIPMEFQFGANWAGFRRYRSVCFLR
jgi:cytochrome bd-type quinol oxidase subunit 1